MFILSTSVYIYECLKVKKIKNVEVLSTRLVFPPITDRMNRLDYSLYYWSSTNIILFWKLRLSHANLVNLERDQILDSHSETAQEDGVKHKLMLKPSLMRNQVHDLSLNLCQCPFIIVHQKCRLVHRKDNFTLNRSSNKA